MGVDAPAGVNAFWYRVLFDLDESGFSSRQSGVYSIPAVGYENSGGGVTIFDLNRNGKPDLIFLDNPNLLYALASHPVKIGTARETFVVNQLSCDNEVEYGKKTGDFRVNGRYILEVGGEGKTYDQIADVPDSYILADGIETPYRCKLPIWIVGFLY